MVLGALAGVVRVQTVHAAEGDAAAVRNARGEHRDAEREMARYLRAARDEQRQLAAGRSATIPPALDLEHDQARWLQSRAEQCAADDVAFWVGKNDNARAARQQGELEALRCQTQMTRQRSHWLWRNWLIGVGAGKAKLPEPALP